MKANRTLVFRWVAWVAALGIAIGLLIFPKPWEFFQKFTTPEHPRDYLAVYGWWTAAFNAGLLFILGILAPWWSLPRNPSSGWLPRVPQPSWMIPSILGAMVVMAVLAAPRLSHSLWDDEENSVRRIIAGQYKQQPDGTWKFRPTKWDAAFWNYKRPTNHHLQSQLSKVFHETWRKLARPSHQQFSEAAIRLPSFLSALLVLPVLAALIGQIGFPRAGLVCAWLLAIHPWFIRYASEARGYMLAILFSLLAMTSLLRALDSGKWKWWLVFAACWLLTLYAHPGTLTLIVFLNLAAALAILLRNPQEFRLAQAGRWFFASCLAGMIFLQLMVPCIPQAMETIEKVLQGELTPRWHVNLFAHFYGGITWCLTDSPNPVYPELRWVVESSPLFWKLLILTSLGLATFGLLRLAIQRPAGWMPASVWVLAPIAVYLMARSSGNYLYEWYLFFALPGILAFVAIGLDFLAARASCFWQPLGAVILSGVLVTFFLATSMPRNALRERPLQHMREAAELARGGLSLWDPGNNGRVIATAAVDLETYEPRVLPLTSSTQLRETMESVRLSNRELIVVQGNPWSLGAQDPELSAFLSDRSIFEEVKTFAGFDPTLTQTVLRWKSKPVEESLPPGR